MSYGPHTHNPWEHDESPEEGLCYFCGEVDDMRNLIKVDGGWMSHEGCAKESPVVSRERYEALMRDIFRDDERRG